METSGPLAGVTVIELAGLGALPFATLKLADMGCDVIRVNRPGEVPDQPEDRGHREFDRGRRSIAVDLKHAEGVEVVLRMVGRADVLVEAMRPGVAERLGVGPEQTMARNPRLVYGRLTGWGQEGPLAHAAAHSINYEAITGAIGSIGPVGGPPVPLLQVLGDFAGGGLHLAYGVACALFEAQRSGEGQVVDVAMVDGVLSIYSVFHAMARTGMHTNEIGTNLFDGGAPFYNVYETADGKFVTIAPLEPHFYKVLLDLLGLDGRVLPEQYDQSTWPAMRERFADIFRTRTRDEWQALLEGTDACFAPVYRLDEAATHPHNVARNAFVPTSGEARQVAPSPRFSRTIPEARPSYAWAGADTDDVLGEMGFTAAEVDDLRVAGRDRLIWSQLMDFDDTPEEAAFRAEARGWLKAHATLKDPDAYRPAMSSAADAGHVERCRKWQRTLYEGGWAGIAWPKAYGGRGASPIESLIFGQEQARFDVSAGVFAVAIGMVGPTLVAHGSDEQKQRYLERMLRGDEIWCQLFSEPGAGSDLAGLSTRAVNDGDEWVVNGQKVWTTGAQHSDLGILLARTDPDVPKHEGITYFVVDMRTPGIDVRPLRQINGVAHFNEVFLDDVRLPADAVVGDINKGWTVARTTLTSERALIGGGFASTFEPVRRLAELMGRRGDPLTRQRLADAYIRGELQRYLGLRMQTALSHGQPVGPEAAVMKLAISHHVSATADMAMALEGAVGMLMGEETPDSGAWQQQFLTQWSMKIGGGTDQIQRNVIGERVLGLPREPRVTS